MKVSFSVNATPVSVDVEPRTTLVDCRRHELNLTGSHVGCEHGVCGACTVIVDGRAVRGCLMLAVQAEGARRRWGRAEKVRARGEGEGYFRLGGCHSLQPPRRPIPPMIRPPVSS